MAYPKTVWDNDITAVDETNMNKIEDGLFNQDARITGVESGWTVAPGTWTYSSADAPTFVIGTSIDLTGVIGLGDKIKLTQTTVKYFIVTAITNTTITVYGGTDYTLLSATISSPSYSKAKSPLGFPIDPLKWTITTSDTSLQTKGSPAANTWYNTGSISIALPVGSWNIYAKARAEADITPAKALNVFITLSTANNSESNVDFTFANSTNSGLNAGATMSIQKNLLIASATTYYLNHKTAVASATNLYFTNNTTKAIITATCAYL